MASVSTSRTRIEEATHFFKVANFSLLKDDAMSEKYVQSTKYVAGYHEWYLTFYPYGYNTEENRSMDGDMDEEYVSLFLVRKSSEDDETAAMFNLTICDQNREEKNSICHGLTRIFKRGQNRHGLSKFCKRSDLENPKASLIKDDSILIRCDLTVLKRETHRIWDYDPFCCFGRGNLDKEQIFDEICGLAKRIN